MDGTPTTTLDTRPNGRVEPGRCGSVRDLQPSQPVRVDEAGYVALLTAATQTRLGYPETLRLIGALLDRIDPTDTDKGLLRAEAMLEVTEASIRVGDRLGGVATRLLGQAVAQEAATIGYGTPTSSWLTHRFPLSRTQAAAMVLSAHRAHPYPDTTTAVEQGQIRPAHAAVVIDALRRLPTTLSLAEADRAEATMLGFAPDYPTDDLTRLGNRLLEVMDPDRADQLLADRITRQEARAWADRYLELRPTGAGTMIIKGMLPQADARQLLLQLDAVAAHHRRTALEQRDPDAPITTLRTRRADALLWLSDRAAAHHDAPTIAGDRPRVVIHVTLDQLHRLSTASGTSPRLGPVAACPTDDEHPVPPRTLRRWLCDPDLQLLVTDTTGRHTHTLSTPARLADPKLRAALALRDRRCVFPGCDVPPHLCDAHHIQPWWQHGPTAVDNLALLCAHHHRLVEPARGDPRDQWHLRMGTDRLPEIIPPTHVDPRQRPLRQPLPLSTLV